MKMIKPLAGNLWLHIKNIPGWSTNRKILIIEADDYGSMRLPSKEVYATLLSKKLIRENYHDKYDNIESKEDLQTLFLVLKNHKDFKGRIAAITPFFNPCNPDLKKIKEENFSTYYCRNYSESLKANNLDLSIMEFWAEGIKLGFFKPQFHGREHLNVPFFMELLQQGNEDLIESINLNYFHPSLPSNPEVQSLRAAYFFKNEQQKEYLRISIVDGLEKFEECFGFKPTVFCPSNGVFHNDFKKPAANWGIKAFVESGLRKTPDGEGGGNQKRKFILGAKSKETATINYCRNVTFEPIRDGLEKSVSKAMKEIDIAFRWHKPAIVATHRVNFSGGISPANRENGLNALSQLLSSVLKKWPDVEFLDSGSLSDQIYNSFFS